MGQFDKNKFASANQEGETPDDLYQRVNAKFKFTCDVCASATNTKCKKFWSASNSCLDKEWSGVNWMNPPFKNMKLFIAKAYEQRHNAVTVCLIPARTNTRWWHQYCMRGVVVFICGRPKFRGYEHGLPQPLALVIFGRREGIMKSFYLNRKGK